MGKVLNYTEKYLIVYKLFTSIGVDGWVQILLKSCKIVNVPIFYRKVNMVLRALFSNV